MLKEAAVGVSYFSGYITNMNKSQTTLDAELVALAALQQEGAAK